MTAVERYNALDGQTVSREELQEIAYLGDTQGQVMISQKIKEVLSQHEDPTFFINISETAIDRVPEDILPGLEYAAPEEEYTGLERAVAPDDIYQMITDKMLTQLKETTGQGYKKKWKKQNEEGYLLPFNFDTKKMYRGINIALLTEGMSKVLKNPFFLTFNQIEKYKGKLKKGSKGLPVVYFTMLYSVSETNDAGEKIEFGTYNKKKFLSWLDKNIHRLKFSLDYYRKTYIPILKYYNVFNGADIERIDFDLENFKTGYQDGSEVVKNNDPRVEIADLIVKHYPKPQPKLKDSTDGRAFYRHGLTADEIHMPKFENFETGLDYYRTLFHEFTHSTGIASRLDRPMSGKFGSKQYAKEELVAEFGAVFLSAHAGIIWYNQKNHAEYLKNWNSVLSHAKDDNRFFMRAASKAQEAADFILNLDTEGVPAYQNSLISESKPEKPKKDQKKEPKKRKPASFKKGDKAFYTDKKQNVTIRKVSIPKKGNSLEHENRVYDISYSNGRKAMAIPESKLEKAKKEDHKPEEKTDRKVTGKIERKKKGSRTFYIPTINGTRINKTNFARKSDAEKLLKATLNAFSDAELLEKIKNFHKEQKDTRKDTNQLLEEQKKAKIQAKTKTEFEKGLKKLGFEIVSYTGEQHSPQEWEREYKLNFKDIAGVSLGMKLERVKKTSKRKDEPEFAGTSKVQAIGLTTEDYIFYDNAQAFYEETLGEMRRFFDMSVSEAADVKKQFKDTLLQPKKPTAQLGLFGTKKKKGKKNGLAAPVENDPATAKQPQPVEPSPVKEPGRQNEPAQEPEPQPVHGNPNSLAARMQRNRNRTIEYYRLDDPEIAKFLGNVEIKKRESVGISITAPQGAGKTRFAFQLMNAFAKNYRVGHASMEEHPESGLYESKALEYIDPQNFSNIEAPEINNMGDIQQLIEHNDVIVIDSFEKLREIDKNVQVDQDFRKKYDGKLFIFIFQLTGDGKMRGGSKSQFDVDIVLFTKKFDDYKENYIYPDKNRYNDIPPSELKFSIYHRTLIREGNQEPARPEPVQDSRDPIPKLTGRLIATPVV